jgi:hypothetical protein
MVVSSIAIFFLPKLGLIQLDGLKTGKRAFVAALLLLANFRQILT